MGIREKDFETSSKRGLRREVSWRRSAAFVGERREKRERRKRRSTFMLIENQKILRRKEILVF